MRAGKSGHVGQQGSAHLHGHIAHLAQPPPRNARVQQQQFHTLMAENGVPDVDEGCAGSTRAQAIRNHFNDGTNS